MIISYILDINNKNNKETKAYKGKINLLKEFNVCYTLDADVKWEKIKKGVCSKKEDVLQEVLKRMEHCEHIIVKSDSKNHIIHTSLIRYIRIFENK